MGRAPPDETYRRHETLAQSSRSKATRSRRTLKAGLNSPARHDRLFVAVVAEWAAIGGDDNVPVGPLLRFPLVERLARTHRVLRLFLGAIRLAEFDGFEVRQKLEAARASLGGLRHVRRIDVEELVARHV